MQVLRPLQQDQADVEVGRGGAFLGGNENFALQASGGVGLGVRGTTAEGQPDFFTQGPTPHISKQNQNSFVSGWL